MARVAYVLNECQGKDQSHRVTMSNSFQLNEEPSKIELRQKELPLPEYVLRNGRTRHGSPHFNAWIHKYLVSTEITFSRHVIGGFIRFSAVFRPNSPDNSNLLLIGPSRIKS